MEKNSYETIYFISTNKFKQNVFNNLTKKKLPKNYKIQFETIKDLPEIQGTCEEVVIDKTISAFKELNTPLIVDDESFLIPGLNNFPGPYLKDFEAALKTKGIYDVINATGNKKCYPQVHYGLTFDGKKVYTFNGSLECELIKYREGTENCKNYFEVLFSKDFNKRLSEVETDEFDDRDMRGIALNKLCKFLEEYKP